MKVLFYGRLSEAIAPEIELASSSNCSIAELRQRLAAAHPHAAATLRSQRSRVLINSSLVGEDFVIGASDQIEFLPPVSGG